MNITERLSDKVKSVPPSGIRKFFDLANEMKGQVISLSIGEPDFVTPWSICEEGIYSLEKGKTHYSPNAGYAEFREEISTYMERKFGLKYDPRDEVLVTVGGSEAIDDAVRALVNPGDEVLIPQPCFVSYSACVLLSGGVPVPVECKAENGFKINTADIENAITEKTKMLIMGFPSNPTGAIMTKEDLMPLAKLLIEKDIMVLSDELYAELTYPPAAHCSIASFPGMRERTVVVNGLSKAFAMTGWRIGFAVAPREIISAMNKIHQYVIMSSPTTAQYAAIEALRNGDSEVEKMRNEYNRRRRIVLNAMENCGCSCFEPLGAFYVFPSIKKTGMSSVEFCEQFLKEEKVAIVPGNAFGDCGEGFVRISYAASTENIEAAMERFIDFINRS